MAKQTIKIKKRVKKDQVKQGYHICGNCNGTGIKRDAGRPSKNANSN